MTAGNRRAFAKFFGVLKGLAGVEFLIRLGIDSMVAVKG